MQVNEIRKKFLDYFHNLGHTIVKSSSLIPHNDPTLLFTNAGMNQFKDIFLGLEKPSYLRAASVQKCVRAGGKHNDLENVGYTARHHTFFEMMGNFSFGDYFKEGAIKYAWKFLTEVLKIPKDKLYVTIYHTDDEAFTIWNKHIELPIDRIIRIGDKEDGSSDNFWQMGDTGPCGPCTEIFYDHGNEVLGGLPGSTGEDGDRYIEIWNCVFMQFNRDEKGVLNNLPKPSVDTGLGLERIAAVMQNVHSNYEIDLFVHLINRASQITECKDLTSPSLKVLADHIRSVSFLLADGVNPSNDGRGYVLRRIIRRAIRHGYKLGMYEPFFYLLVQELIVQMGEAYPELIANQAQIEKIILNEEERFFQTIEHGMKLLNEEVLKVENKILSGDIAFKLYDTYGFPLDLTEDICREMHINVDVESFEILMCKQKERAHLAGKFKIGALLDYSGADSEFFGYDKQSVEAKVIAIYQNNKPVNSLLNEEEGIIILDKTVFYAESGGQIGDTGVIQINGGLDCIFNVSDTQKIRQQVTSHIGKLINGTIKVGDEVIATIDVHRRNAITRNHSATHILHKALHKVLGEHALQKGSLVCDEYTRFDFAHDKALTVNEIQEIERIVNFVIMNNYEVKFSYMKFEEAIKSNIIALFEEKYTDEVRVVKMGDFSKELCGGTHVSRTGDIGVFTIVSESGVANGIRRIESITGETAVLRMQKNMEVLDKLRYELKAQTNDIIPEKLNMIFNDNKGLIKQVMNLQSKLALLEANEFIKKVEILANGVKFISLELANIDNKIALELVDKLKDKLVSGIIIIAIKVDKQASFLVGVTKDLSTRYKAMELVKYLSNIAGGKGGGRPELAQAGGADVEKIFSALKSIKEYILESI